MVALPVLNTETTNCFNKVLMGDALEVLRSIEGKQIFDIVIADPPYNIGKDFGNDSDCQDLQNYIPWATRWIDECLRLVKESAPVYVYGYPEILAHIAVRYPVTHQRWLAWHYTNKAVPSSKFWQRSHESILCLWHGDRPQINVDALREDYTDGFIKNSAGKIRKDTACRYGREGVQTIYNAHPKGALPRDVIKVPALAGGAGRAERWFYCKDCQRVCSPQEKTKHQRHETVHHPTQKPAELCRKLVASAIKDTGYLLVPFAGSGAECVVAQKMGIDFFAVEINSDYVMLANAWLEEQGSRLL